MILNVEEVLEITGGKLVSEVTEAKVSGLGALDEAGDCDISFLGNEKYYQDYLNTKAGVVLVPSGVPELIAGVVLVEVENPSYSFGLIVKLMASRQRKFKAGVHPAAYVDPSVKFDAEKVSILAGAVIEAGCEIGDGSEVGLGCVLGEGVKIGKGSVIHANVTIREFCEIGDRSILQPGCVIGSDGYGYELVDGKHEKVDQVGIVVIGNDVEIGANSTIDRARFGKTVIGDGTKVDNLVQIAHNVRIGKHCLIVSQVGIAGSAELGNYVTIAAQSGVAGHLKVGDETIVLGKSGVTKDISGGMHLGYPAGPAGEERRKIASLRKIPQMLKDLKALKKG